MREPPDRGYFAKINLCRKPSYLNQQAFLGLPFGSSTWNLPLAWLFGEGRMLTNGIFL